VGNTLPKKTVLSELIKEKLSQGGQKKRYEDYLKQSLGIWVCCETWETLALDLTTWRSKINKAAVLFKQSRRAEAQRKLQLCKSKLTSLPPVHEIHQCPEGCRAVRACIGQSSHSSTLHQFFRLVMFLAIVDSN